MGRELRRVPLDFAWPLERTWEGFLNPYWKLSQKCTACKGRGSNPGMREVDDDFYGFERPERRWCDKITQDELDALITEGRLRDYTSVWNPDSKAWIPRSTPPTVETINEAQRTGHVHDAINSWILVKARCKRLGISTDHCEVCGGEGNVWPGAYAKALHEAWQEIPPPEGPGYQFWETTSEGSPISPVFATAEEMIEWLIKDGGYNPEAARRFVEGKGWAPSLVVEKQGGVVVSVKRDVDSC
jgi:hypothetical protein